MTYVLLKPERLDEHWYTIPHVLSNFLEVVLYSWDKWIHHFQNGFFDKKWCLLIMNCPIVCRQFFNQVNFLAGVYIYLKIFFFFYKHMSIYSRLQVNTNKILFQHALFASLWYFLMWNYDTFLISTANWDCGVWNCLIECPLSIFLSEKKGVNLCMPFKTSLFCILSGIYKSIAFIDLLMPC